MRAASRVVGRVAVGLLLMLVAAEVILRVTSSESSNLAGADFQIYRDAARRWLSGGGFYPAFQTSGPYLIGSGAALYPPLALILFVPFAYLPGIMWSAVPAVIMAAVIWYHRPSTWAWVVILACIGLSPETQTLYWFGTPTIWMAAFVALGTIWGWPAALVLLKPAIFPFALIGVRDRRWWIAAAAMAVVSLALLPLWIDWFTILANARGPRANVLYALGDLPILVMPLVARGLGTSRNRSRPNQDPWASLSMGVGPRQALPPES